jgi:hypothetical protein
MKAIAGSLDAIKRSDAARVGMVRKRFERLNYAIKTTR